MLNIEAMSIPNAILSTLSTAVYINIAGLCTKLHGSLEGNGVL